MDSDFVAKEKQRSHVIDTSLDDLSHITRKLNKVGEALYISGNLSLSERLCEDTRVMDLLITEIRDNIRQETTNYMEMSAKADAEFLKTLRGG